MKQCVQVERVAALFSVTIGYYLMDLCTPSLISRWTKRALLVFCLLGK